MKAVLGWLGRTGLLYLTLCAAIAFSLLVLPRLADEFSTATLRQDMLSVSQVGEELARERAVLQDELEKREKAIKAASLKALEQQLDDARKRRAELARALETDAGFLDSVRPSRILARQKAQLQLAAIEIEVDALEQAREARIAQSAAMTAHAALQRYRRIPTADAVLLSKRLCREAQADLRRFDALNRVEQTARDLVLRQRAALEAERSEKCSAARQREQRRKLGLAAREKASAARERFERVREWTSRPLPQPAPASDQPLFRDVLILAAWALLGVLLLPYAIRTILYYLVAPIASRRKGLRLSVTGTTAIQPNAQSGGSEASCPIELGTGEELLVRQGYLQSSPVDADMRTRFLLDWSSPFASIARGMAVLTRVRGAGTRTTVSANDDPFAEVAILDIPDGASLVLQPRALAGVVQPENRPLRIESKWRIFSLNAWLTQQLRFLIFHGPVRLVLKGGRGVRIEPVESGRRFGQDQLVGFSADLAYRVTRTETFVPYLIGREPLLRDRIEGGEGILIIEEAPRAGNRKGVRGALEGMFDAALKAFGI